MSIPSAKRNAATHSIWRAESSLTALDSYLRDLGEDEITVLLELEGTLGDRDEAELRARIEAARAVWRTS